MSCNAPATSTLAKATQGGYIALTENAAKSRISGFGAELTAKPVPRVGLA
jgi:hypothetical protein